MTFILKKLLGPVALVLIGIVAGGFGALKLQKPVTIPDQPDCICPAPTVSVQPFDVDKIKGLREFNYSPQFTGSIQVAGVDSSSIRRMIDVSVDKAFQKYMVDKKGKRINWKDLEISINSAALEAKKKTDSIYADRIRELTFVDKSIFLPE